VIFRACAETPHADRSLPYLEFHLGSPTQLRTPSFMAIGSRVLLPGVAENPTFPILSTLAYTTGLSYCPTCDVSESGESFIAILDQSSVNVDYRHFKPAIDNFSGHHWVQVMFVWTVNNLLEFWCQIARETCFSAVALFLSNTLFFYCVGLSFHFSSLYHGMLCRHITQKHTWQTSEFFSKRRRV